MLKIENEQRVPPRLRLLTISDLRERGIRYHRAHIFRLVKAGQFPRPIKLGLGRGGAVAWVEQEIDAYIQARMAARDAQ
jgi:prophage regulatory protein